jgi:hypothetical protein
MIALSLMNDEYLKEKYGFSSKYVHNEIARLGKERDRFIYGESTRVGANRSSSNWFKIAMANGGKL